METLTYPDYGEIGAIQVSFFCKLEDTLDCDVVRVQVASLFVNEIETASSEMDSVDLVQDGPELFFWRVVWDWDYVTASILHEVDIH